MKMNSSFELSMYFFIKQPKIFSGFVIHYSNLHGQIFDCFDENNLANFCSRLECFVMAHILFIVRVISDFDVYLEDIHYINILMIVKILLFNLVHLYIWRVLIILYKINWLKIQIKTLINVNKNETQPQEMYVQKK